MARVTIVGKPGCHLCEEMHLLVKEVCHPRGDVIEEISVLDYPELAEKYWEEIPVLLIDDRKVAFWRVSKAQLLEALDSAPTVGH
jgi:hypothetical protein